MPAVQSLEVVIAERRAAALIRAYELACDVPGPKGAALRGELEAVGQSLDTELQARERAAGERT